MKPIHPDEIRTRFSRALSDMYRAEVPQYGTLLDLVAAVNAETLAGDPALRESLHRTDATARLNLERHGAIRLGTGEELAMIRRIFAVMGMHPVGYYDLASAGVPVHATAFRPITDQSLQRNPFRMFTSLLRLDLIADKDLRRHAAGILAQRRIFTPNAIALTERHERAGYLTDAQSDAFVREILETFRWHRTATVSADIYRQLNAAHRLIADVVSFQGPHVNHLTPRSLNIDLVQARMPAFGIAAKAVIEGPPRRACPILLRQTSFKALEEPIAFPDASGNNQSGTHTARFGEIEQRGVALTRKGRALYDQLLATAQAAPAGRYNDALAESFHALPDDWHTMRDDGLAFFRYMATPSGIVAKPGRDTPLATLITDGHVTFDPIIYEDFLPVSAAGIFQSNLGDSARHTYNAHANREAFEAYLGATVQDEFALYEQAEQASIDAARKALSGSSARHDESAPGTEL